MKKNNAIYFFAALACLASCTQVSPDAEADILLQKSRQHFAEGRYDVARDSILSLRRRHPTAIETRSKALLLLDSIEMTAAKDSLGSATGEEWKRLSVKAQFYERKLLEDKNKLGL